MTENRVYTTGEKPQNPIILDVVYLISDIREEPQTEHPAEEGAILPTVWSYVVDDVLTIAEYQELKYAELEEHILELDLAFFEKDMEEA